MVSLEDDLYYSLCAITEAFCFVIADSGGEVSPRWVKLLVTHAQAKAERQCVRTRQATLKQDQKLPSLLAFSGIPN